jgi:hypothetical protein
MASSYTLATLKTSIKDFVEDQGDDFDGSLDDLIKLAEDKCLTDLDLDIFDATDSVTLTISTQTASIPTSFVKIRSMFYTSGTTRTFMEQRTYEYLIDYWPSTSTTGTPLYWAPYTTTTVYVAPTPSSTLTATARGIKRPASVVTDTAGSWLSLNCGSLLLKACLVVSEQFNVSDDRVPGWKSEYAEDLAQRRIEFRHLLHRDYDLPMMPQPPEGK